MSDETEQPSTLDDDRVELALRSRITVLEEWRDRAEPALALLGVALIAMAFTGLCLTLVLRKRLA